MTMILKTKFQSLAAVVREIKKPDDLQVNVGGLIDKPTTSI